ncbi:tRNA pseudouridine(38-40) synthase TruA [Hyphomicrobium sp. DY-1]|uniref:tRNA pseudouridine(38-40) synthase TruA n=1 Tax=Hyphomicrobium sp. DY-1 TaxID=3075650 RepID=UPI0039C43DF3
MPRYRITIEYDGTPFVGWQRQAQGLSIQGLLEDAIRKFSQETVGVRGAGRTDAGVHALGQVAHFDLSKEWSPGRVRDAMNFHLRPHPIGIVACAAVDAEFDARFSAIKRHYKYRLLTRRAPPILDRNRVWWTMQELDAGTMHEAAQVLVGKHDFTTFRAAQCQAASPVKTLDRFEISRDGDEIVCAVSARSFLHHQVRSMVGSLKLVGEGKWARADLAKALAAANREACGPVAPASGLYLVAVNYPPANVTTSSYPPSPAPEIPDV